MNRRLFQLCTKCDVDVPILYFIGQKDGSCDAGLMITKKYECQDACTRLMIKINTLDDGYVCIRNQNFESKCEQNFANKVGGSNSPICKNAGKLELIF